MSETLNSDQNRKPTLFERFLKEKPPSAITAVLSFFFLPDELSGEVGDDNALLEGESTEQLMAWEQSSDDLLLRQQAKEILDKRRKENKV